MTDRPTEGDWRDLSPYNLAYLEDMYELYMSNPSAVEPALRATFSRLGAPPSLLAYRRPVERPSTESFQKLAAVAALAHSIRAYGHRAAKLDPLGSAPPGDHSLDIATYNLSEADLALLPAEAVGGPIARRSPDALTAIRELQRIYQGTTGFEFEHLSNAEERLWWEHAVETERFRPPQDPIDELGLLERLTEVGALERFLHRTFPGHIRFSLEGLGIMVPVLDEILRAAAEAGTATVMLGMAHRGRLNVLAHVLGKPYEQIIAEFMGVYQPPGVSHTGSSDPGWTGDVKYHLGAQRSIHSGKELEMVVHLAPNPSHLEWVNPVVLGMVRAASEHRGEAGPPVRADGRCLAILIHGDASFPAQGIVAETLNLYRLPGYSVGGSIHIIANNQVGFTTGPELGRSTSYASDLAKGFDIPVIHVNADDVEACIAAARAAHAYRQQFKKDVVIDLVGYRRWGHNETDEPSFTQPLMYRRIAQHPTVRELWVQELVRRGLITAEQAERRLQDAIERLHDIRRRLAAELKPQQPLLAAGLEAGKEEDTGMAPGDIPPVDTQVSVEFLARLNDELTRVPQTFHLHPKLQKPFARRRAIFSPEALAEDAATIEWAHAEALAIASVLADGVPVRMTGQDATRGTFSQRHLILHDVETGATYTPLQALPSARASFEAWDSPLSEAAVLGFEYGYSVQAQDALVLWEAQYGDFVNVAQVIVDQFIASGRAKWGQRSGLVLLLPHGYEGQGPEHSSARIERFLQLAAENNMIVANCTTAAQYFHLLRRQAAFLKAGYPRPLILFTPKSLLRNPLAASKPSELSRGKFMPVIPDARALERPEGIKRVILCSGKVYADLVTEMARASDPPSLPIAVIRIEQLYPFPHSELAGALASFPNFEEVVWLQEEPRNMGPWTFVAPRIRELLDGRAPLRYVGRPVLASPAEGTQEWHQMVQSRIMGDALNLATLPSAAGGTILEPIPDN